LSVVRSGWNHGREENRVCTELTLWEARSMYQVMRGLTTLTRCTALA
jgi:hypothetical protein